MRRQHRQHKQAGKEGTSTENRVMVLESSAVGWAYSTHTYIDNTCVHVTSKTAQSYRTQGAGPGSGIRTGPRSFQNTHIEGVTSKPRRRGHFRVRTRASQRSHQGARGSLPSSAQPPLLLLITVSLKHSYPRIGHADHDARWAYPDLDFHISISIFDEQSSPAS